ncbi:unnamed protein product [Withania somnifera]
MELGSLQNQLIIEAVNHSLTCRPANTIGLANSINLDSSEPHFDNFNGIILDFRRKQDGILRLEMERSMSLLQMMVNEGLAPCREEEMKRRNAIDKLKKIVVEWVKAVTYQRGLPKKVYNSVSDTDALCVGPYFATVAEDFFINLHNMLASRPEVSEIHCVKDAKVTLMRLKFDRISTDLPYARLKVISDPEVFQAVLCCIKLWAKRRGVYASVRDSWTRSPASLLLHFMLTLSSLGLLNIFSCSDPLEEFTWQCFQRLSAKGIQVSWMPIQVPCSPFNFCHSNITPSTFCKIRTEFLRGHLLTMILIGISFFEPFPYARRYGLFVKIFLSLEELLGFFDPNPTEYIDMYASEPNIIFYWEYQLSVDNGYQGSTGSMKLSIVKAYQFPKKAESVCERKNTKPCWRPHCADELLAYE